MLSEQNKTDLRQRLEDEQSRLKAEIENQHKETIEMTQDQVDEFPYSNHMDDTGSDLQEIARISAVQDNAEILLKQVEKALQRMAEGTYGVSEVSGKEIPLERLEAIPYATRLVDEETDTAGLNR